MNSQDRQIPNSPRGLKIHDPQARENKATLQNTESRQQKIAERTLQIAEEQLHLSKKQLKVDERQLQNSEEQVRVGKRQLHVAVAGLFVAIVAVVLAWPTGGNGPKERFTAKSTAPTREHRALSPISVTITSPQNNSVFSVGDTVSLKANAVASSGIITAVTFNANSTPVWHDSLPPYEMEWGNVAKVDRLTDPTNNPLVRLSDSHVDVEAPQKLRAASRRSSLVI
jgi:Bacterial Ig domain